MILTNTEAWPQLIKEALKAWHHTVELGNNPLAQLQIVAKRQQEAGYADDLHGRSQAIRDVLRQAIQALGVPGAEPPTAEDALQWLDPHWRPYSLLTLLYLRGWRKGQVQDRIGLAEGGQYYKEQHNAIILLAALLQDWEGLPASDSATITLEYPSGAVKPSDAFYIERKADADLRYEMQQPGRTVTLRGPRQVGKTSLLIRGVNAAMQVQQAWVVYVDLQAWPQTSLASGELFLRQLADWLADECAVSPEVVEASWHGRLPAARKLTRFMEHHILPQADTPLLLALDEIDRLLLTDFHTDFFGLLRSWHNLRSRSEVWARFSLLMAISTEPYLLINDMQQSPFNVGLTLHLEDFGAAQVEALNQRYGVPLAEAELTDLMRLLRGHPYLTRVAFYTLVKDKLTLPDLLNIAASERGPFSAHLQYQWQLLRQDVSLQTAFRQILATGAADNDRARFRLLKAGLIRAEGNRDVCRCDLYHDYFTSRL